MARLEEILRRVAGSEWSIRIESGPQNGNPKPARKEERTSTYRNHRAEALKHPLVNAAIEKLDATMVEVDEGFGLVADGTPASPEPPTESQPEE